MRLEFGVEFVFTSLLLQRCVRIKLCTAVVVVMVDGRWWDVGRLESNVPFRFAQIALHDLLCLPWRDNFRCDRIQQSR